jgi:ATP-dependent helicase/DNAse subunit B
MTATVRIVCGPAGSGKTQYLLERYARVARSGIGTALWLGPTHRSVEALRERLAGCAGPILAPHLLTFQDFAEEIIRVNDPAARPLSDVQRRLVADDLVAQLHARGELSHFEQVIETRGFAEGVFAFLAELKRNEVWPAQFARSAYRRGYQGPRVARTRNGQAISVKDRQCARVYAQYQRLLIRQHLYDLEGRLWYARDLLARGVCRPFNAVRAVFLDGFSDFTRTQHDILAALRSRVEELWITLPDEPSDERAELFTVPRATLQRLEDLQPEILRLGRPASPQAAAGFSSCPALPAGLAHVERQLFRPLRAVEQADDAEGILCIEAPGLVGEARLVARQVKTLLLDGVSADDIVVCVRDLVPYADLVREVFGDYGIPLDVEGADPLARNPAVAVLLRILRLPDDDWPFHAVTAFLRSGYFRPDWPESRAVPEVAQLAEVLLRRLGEPRGRAAYLEAVRRWAEDPPSLLEDEQALESRRQRTHELAKLCRPFLERFFHAWDHAPQQASLADHLAWLLRCLEDLGIARAAGDDARDAAAVERLRQELGRWLQLAGQLYGPAQTLPRKVFLRRLGALAAEAGLARTQRGPGRVRFLSAELARDLEVPYLFVMGLGERSFPRLAAPEPFFDEQERLAFKRAGLDFACVGDQMPAEMLLFYQLVARARGRLVLSYAAIDDKGQALLPSSFLHTLRECFRPGAIPVERRTMLIERYDREPPLCPAEYRVRVASAMAAGAPPPQGLSPGVPANLAAAAAVHRLRLGTREFNSYDGLLRHPTVVAEVGRLLGPEKVFSPTALEDYIACPFRFFLRHVLRLEPLEEPDEEIEVTRRGAAFHRALSRLHFGLQAEGLQRPGPEVEGKLAERLHEAVQEYVARAPSPASKELWRLEGRRLQRLAARYPAQWRQFVNPWAPQGVVPEPYCFEVDFGLPARDGQEVFGPLTIQADGTEVRVSGRIDRVDVAPLPDGAGLGFWIIDYKTGRSMHYTGTDLKEFRRLQLTLYALAVEEVLLTGQPARPLGMAYWLVADSGPKVVLPGRNPVLWLTGTDGWETVREQLRQWVVTLVTNIRQGVFPLKPRSEDCTQTCDYSQICRIAQARVVDKPWELAPPCAEAKDL